ncbi:hypothetical protein CA13_73220 [Planctomycetes bacterium CA13]|uniref:Uncharacterized protein n=1 Tax=Novipirellula herctigrandis TaxID=2527986 RepID=A0A5C5YLQ9_9BACT|nr:hypothetical protein CA13_73220 [Planctomycetes bacterium CA13]
MIIYLRSLFLLSFISAAVCLCQGSVAAQSATLQADPVTTASKTAAKKSNTGAGKRGGVPTRFYVDPGWQAERFPKHAVCYESPDKIAAIYAQTLKQKQNPVTSYEKPLDGSLRIVGTGHSFMMPGYKTLPLIARAAGFQQPPLLTHVGGGITGSARYKWEEENGIFQFDGRPKPMLLSSIAGAQWDAMMWGPYYDDRTEYYSCWIDFCHQHNQNINFYLSDAWPQLDQLKQIPRSEDELTSEVVAQMHQDKRATYQPLIEQLNRKYGNHVFVLPTSQAMVLAVDYYHRGQLPGVEGIHKAIGGKERSLWRDRLGHLGNGMESLEGYVFYATLYGRSPELIAGKKPITTAKDYPSPELDRMFRKIAWQAVITDPLSGVIDQDKNGIADDRQ